MCMQKKCLTISIVTSHNFFYRFCLITYLYLSSNLEKEKYFVLKVND